MSEQDKPVLKELNVSFSAGGKVSIIKYDVASNYLVSAGHRYEIPESWTDEQIKEFEAEVYDKLRQDVDARAQKEFDERWEQSFMS